MNKFKITVIVIAGVAVTAIIVATLLPKKEYVVPAPSAEQTVAVLEKNDLPDELNEYVEENYQQICKAVDYGNSTFDFNNIHELCESVYICPYSYGDEEVDTHCCTFTQIPQTGEWIYVIEDYAEWKDK